MADFIKICEWARFQHYKDRNPPWIKLHRELLMSQTWVCGDDASRVLAIALMLLAAIHDNKIPADLAYIRRVAYLAYEPDLSYLLSVHFIEIIDDKGKRKQTLADFKHSVQFVRPETETETETETEKKILPAHVRSRPTKSFPGNSQSQQTKALGETRHIRVQKIVMGWYQAWSGAECPWNGGEAKQLSDLLKSTPHWPDQQFITCLDNLGKSACVAVGDRPREWLGRLPKFLKGPLDKFKNPQVDHGQNERTIQNTAATRAAVAAGVDKFLRRKNAVDNQDVPRTPAPVPGNSS